MEAIYANKFKYSCNTDIGLANSASEVFTALNINTFTASVVKWLV